MAYATQDGIFAVCVFFIAGIVVFVVFLLRWEASVEYERNSTTTTCTILQVTTEQVCKNDKGHYAGTKWGYNIETPKCPGAILFRGDDTCNGSPIGRGETKTCRVHDNCGSFKWKHQTTVNKNSTFVGVGILAVSVIMAVALFVCWKRRQIRKKAEKDANTAPQRTATPPTTPKKCFEPDNCAPDDEEQEEVV